MHHDGANRRPAAGLPIVAAVLLLWVPPVASLVATAGEGSRAGSRVAEGPSEPNNDAATAMALAGNTTITGSVSKSDPVDVFRLNLTAGNPTDRIDATLSFTANTLVGWVTVLDPSGLRLNQTNTTGAVVTVAALATTTSGYYITVVWGGPNDALTLVYTLNVNRTTAPAGGDLNDALSEASVLAAGAVTGTVTLLTDPADFYRIHLAVSPAMHAVALLDLTEPAGAGVVLELYNQTGIYISSAEGATGGSLATLYHVPAATTDVFARVWAGSGGGSYRLELVVGAGYPDNDNSLDDGALIAAGATVTGNVTTGVDDEDNVRIALRAGEEVTATLVPPGFNATLQRPDLDLWLHGPGPDHDFIARTQGPGASLAVVGTAIVDGDHVLRIVTGNAVANGSYVLTVTVVSPPRVNATGPILVQEDANATLDLRSVFDDPGPVGYALESNGSIAVTIQGPVAAFAPVEPNWSGQETVVLSGTNAVNKTARADLTVIVVPVDDAPTADPGYRNLTVTWDEDTNTTLKFALSAAFTDVDDPLLAYDHRGDGPLGFQVGADDHLTLIPPPDWNGVENVTITATDPQNLSATIVLRAEVTPVPDAPSILQPVDRLAIEEDSAATIDLKETFGDADGEPLGYTAFAGEGAEHLDPRVAGTVLTITPVANWSGSENITVVAADPGGLEARLNITVTVAAVPDGPVVRADTRTSWNPVRLTEDPDHPPVLNLSLLFIDGDGDLLRYAADLVVAGPVQSLDLVASDLTIILRKDAAGQATIELKATDPTDRAVMTTISVDVLPVNDPPDIRAFTVDHDSGTTRTSFTFTARVADADDDPVAVTLVVGGTAYPMSPAPGGSTRAGLNYTVTINLAGGRHTASVTADDLRGGSQGAPTFLTVVVTPQAAATDTLPLAITSVVIVLAIMAILFVRSRQREYDEELERELEEEDEEGLGSDGEEREKPAAGTDGEE